MKRSNDVAFQGQSPASPLSIFCVAAPTDEALLAQWEIYLLPLQQAHLISCWSTRQATAGANIEQERLSHLNHADLILLLLSADFFASNECLAVMKHALERQRAGSARVISLLLRPVEWQETELAPLTSLPTNGVPVIQWASLDEAWHACVLGLQPILRRRLSIASPTPSSMQTQRRAASDRERMLGRLRKTYQELLGHSLQGITWMELGLANKPDAVRTASHLLVRLPQRDEQILPPGTSILYAYEQAQEELLILGAPGAGKSTLLLDLALQLVERATIDETHPLPVILPLSSWAVQRLPFAEWLIEQIAHIYDVPWMLSKRWVEQEYILPLLDGLDEMEETARSACIIAINIYHSEHLTPLVVCSRQSEYEVAAIRQSLVLQSAVIVKPLTAEHIETSLRLAGSTFSGLRAALNQQPALRELATTPLMLSVLLLTYQGSFPDAVVPPDTNLEQRVWTDYIARMVKRKGNETDYPLERTRRWLTYLAKQMRVHQQTIFYAEYLQADWLTRKKQRMMVRLSIRIPALVLGVLTSFLVLSFMTSAYPSVDMLQMGLLGGFIGWCLSQNYNTRRTAITMSYLSVSKRVRLISCVLFGIFVAASFGFSLGPDYFTGNWIVDGVTLGLGSGLSAGVFQMFLFRVPRKHTTVSSVHPSLRWHIFAWFNIIAPRNIWQAALALGAGMGLSIWLNLWLNTGLEMWLSTNRVLDLSFWLGFELRSESDLELRYGLSIWLSVVLMIVLVHIILNSSIGTLRFAERIRWTWQSLLRTRHLRISLIVINLVLFISGLSEGLGNGLTNGPINGLSIGLSYGLSVGLSIGLSYWLLLGLYQGMVQEHVEDQDRHQFNQGIHRSLRNGMLISLVSASIITGIGILNQIMSIELIYKLNIWFSQKLDQPVGVVLIGGLREQLSFSLSNGWILMLNGFLLMWAMNGGLTILRHYVIRWFLAQSHRFPWRAQAFLDDATARILLQRVGGGYRFMHRRLLDYFADLDRTARRRRPPLRQN